MTRLLRSPVPGQLSLLELLEEVVCGGQVAASGRVRVPVPVRLAVGPVGQRLGEWERAVLAFAAEHHLSGRYAERLQEQLGCGELRYVQALSGLLEHPEALAAEPALIGRLRGLRDRRRGLRAPGRGSQLR